MSREPKVVRKVVMACSCAVLVLSLGCKTPSLAPTPQAPVVAVEYRQGQYPATTLLRVSGATALAQHFIAEEGGLVELSVLVAQDGASAPLDVGVRDTEPTRRFGRGTIEAADTEPRVAMRRSRARRGETCP